MTILHSTFRRFRIQSEDAQFRDIEFEDASPNSLRRSWVLTIDKRQPEKSYAILMRSYEDDSDFEIEIQLPIKMIETLKIIAGATAEVGS